MDRLFKDEAEGIHSRGPFGKLRRRRLCYTGKGRDKVKATAQQEQEDGPAAPCRYPCFRAVALIRVIRP